jgi:multidrug efflux pump
MIFGALPIAFTLNSRQSLGIVITGGLIFAGILTLFIIPAVYSYLSSNNKTVEKVLEDMSVNEDSLNNKHQIV